MLAVAGTFAIAIATDFTNLALIGRNDLLSAIDRGFLARAHRRDLGVGECASAAWLLRQAAFEARGAGAEARLGVAGAALVGEAAVPTAAALGLGAAFDVGWGTGAGVADVLAAALGAVGG